MELNIIVCVKQVPKDDAVINWKNGKLVRNFNGNMLNPDDLNAIECARFLKDKYGGKISVITLGPTQAEKVLRSAYSFGVDNCILITDPHFAGSDTLITSKILFKSLKYLEKRDNRSFDIVITGVKSIDGSTAQVSYQLAEYLNIPHITQIHEIKIDKEENNAIARVKRIFGHEYQDIKVTLPILCAMDRNANTPRFPKLVDIKHSYEKEIIIISMKEIGGTSEEYGQSASPTITLDGEMTKHIRKNEEFTGNIDEKVEQLVDKLRKYNVLGN